MTQAINYTKLLQVPFSFSSNGDNFVFRDATMGNAGLSRHWKFYSKRFFSMIEMMTERIAHKR